MSGTYSPSSRFSCALIIVLGASLALSSIGYAQGVEHSLLDLARIQEDVESNRVSSFDRSGGNNDRYEDIADGETLTLFDEGGSGIIKHIWITIAPPPAELSRNDIILRMYWDGREEPCVEAPIGPFFGQGWDEQYLFKSLPLSAGPRSGRALVSYFAMPFSDGARIEIENDTGRKIDAFYYYVDYVEMDELPDDMGRFHAWYNHEVTEAPTEGENEWAVLGPQGENTTGAENYLIADIEGKGHFVGVNYYAHSPTPVWYGEGDDMIFIDGEDWPPSLAGTGTEDYFNTAWVPKRLFSHPYFGYARVNDGRGFFGRYGEGANMSLDRAANEGIGWLGRTHAYRFHIADPIHFSESLRFTIEHGHNNSLTLALASVAYWYQVDPHKPFPPFPDREARAPKPPIGPVDMHRWRHEWRKNMGNVPTLWGDEEKQQE